MKKTVTVTLEPNDYEILKRHLDDHASPCATKCRPSDRMACCGCPEHREWKQMQAEVEEAGLSEVLSDLQTYFQLAAQVQKFIKTQERQRQKLIDMGIDLTEFEI